MPYKPQDVVYPKSRIRRVVEVLFDGTQHKDAEFSIAKLELHDGQTVFGLRHDTNYWNEGNPDVGYPTCRPGNPTWFILPNPERLTAVLSGIFVGNS